MDEGVNMALILAVVGLIYFNHKSGQYWAHNEVKLSQNSAYLVPISVLPDRWTILDFQR